MTRTLSLLFLFFFFLSCNSNNELCQNLQEQQKSTIDTACPTSPDDETSQSDDPTGPVPAKAFNWDTDIFMANFSPEQEAKVHAAVDLIKKVIVSQEFKDRIINHTFNGKKTFVDNGGFSNEEIYNIILDGAETLMPTKNNTMNVELELYYQATNTIGYTYPNTVRIWMNTKYFNNYTPVKVADNLMHEWMHKLGFDHATSYSKNRDYSVPYAVGYLVEELAAKHLQQ